MLNSGLTIIKGTFITVFASALIVVALIFALINTQLGVAVAHYATQQVHGLSIQSIEGTLFDGIRIDQLTLTQPGTDIAIDHIELKLNRSCLWNKALCVDYINVDQGDIHLITQPNNEDSASKSPLSLPFPIRIDALALTQIDVAFDETRISLTELLASTALHQNESHIDITDSAIKLNGLSITLTPSNAQASPLAVTGSKNAKFDLTTLSIDNIYQQIEDLQTALNNQVSHYQSQVSQITQFTYDPNWLTQLPNLTLPVRLDPLRIELTNINVFEKRGDDINTLAENVAIDTTLSIHETLVLNDLHLSAAGFSATANLELSPAYAYQIDLEAQWESAWAEQFVPLSPIPLNTLSLSGAGDLAQPQVNLTLDGNWQMRASLNADFASSLLPVTLDMSWSQIALDYNAIALDLAPGNLQIQGNLEQADMSINTLANRVNTPTINVSNVGLTCRATFSKDATRQTFSTQACAAQLVNRPINIDLLVDLSADSSQFDMNIDTDIRGDDPFWQWQVNAQPLSALLGDIQLSPNSLIALSLNGSGPLHQPQFNTQLRIEQLTLAPSSPNQTGALPVQSILQQAQIEHRLSLSQTELSLALSGQLNAMPLQLSTGLSATLTDQRMSATLRPIELTVDDYALTSTTMDITLDSTTTETVPGDIAITPLTLALTQHTIPSPLMALTVQLSNLDITKNQALAQLDLSQVKLQPMLDIAARLGAPVDIQTDAIMDVEFASAFDNGAIQSDVSMTLSPSSFALPDDINLSIKQFSVKGDVAFSLAEPLENAIANADIAILGDNLGEVNAQLVFDNTLAIYTNVKTINLGLFAPFVPQLSQFEGNASANVALLQRNNDFFINGVIIVPELTLGLEKLPPSVATTDADIVLTQSQPQVFDIDETDQPSVPFGIIVDTNIVIDPMRNNTVNISALDFSTSLNGNLNVTMQQNNLSVLGDLNLIEGTYAAYGQDLLIRRGGLTFNGPVSLPYIDLEAIRNPNNMNDDVIAGIRVQGTTNNLSATLFAEPELENPEILSYIIRGKGLGASSDEDNSVLLTNALLGFGLGRSEGIVDKFGDAIGIDDLQFQTAGAGDQTQLGVSGQINDRLSVEYSMGVFSDVAEFGLRYQWRPELFVEATSGATSALDIFYQISWGERTP